MVGKTHKSWEFLVVLVEELQKTEFGRDILELFKGEIEYFVYCEQCKSSKTRKCEFETIFLEQEENKSLESALSTFLSGDLASICDICENIETNQSPGRISHFPPVLIIRLLFPLQHPLNCWEIHGHEYKLASMLVDKQGEVYAVLRGSGEKWVEIKDEEVREVRVEGQRPDWLFYVRVNA